MKAVNSTGQWVSTAFWIVFACSLQIAITIRFGENAIRIGASDLLVPAIFGFLLTYRNRQFIHNVLRDIFSSERAILLWLGAASGWLAVSLLIGYADLGRFLPWAVLNKFAGWFLLIGYFLSGWLLVRRRPESTDKILCIFIGLAAITAAVTIIVQAVLQVRFPEFFANYPAYQEWLAALPPIVRVAGEQYARLEGLFANPNAFGVLLASSAVLLAPFLRGHPLVRPSLQIAMMTALLAGLVLSGSRSAWLGFGLGLTALAWCRALDIRRMFLCVGLAAALLGYLTLQQGLFLDRAMPGPEESTTHPEASAAEIAPGPQDGPQYNILGYAARTLQFELDSSGVRWKMMGDAIDHWLSAPILGRGLGTMIGAQIEDGIASPVSIHSTPLWLLAETGLVGFLIFAGLFVAVLRALRQPAGDSGGDAGRMRRRIGVIGVVFVLAGASMTMETLYQRYVWFLLGLALAGRAGRSTALEMREPSDPPLSGGRESLRGAVSSPETSS